MLKILIQSLISEPEVKKRIDSKRIPSESAFLSVMKKPATSIDISKKLGLNRHYVGKHLRVLEKRGLVTQCGKVKTRNKPLLLWVKNESHAH